MTRSTQLLYGEFYSTWWMHHQDVLTLTLKHHLQAFSSYGSSQQMSRLPALLPVAFGGW